MRNIHLHALVALVALALVAGCGGDDTTGPDPVAVADVGEFLAALPTWQEFSPILSDAEEATGETTNFEEVVGDATYNCQTTPFSITRTPDKIVTMNPDYEVLWPGSLLQGKGYAMGIGSLAELPIRERAPLVLSIDLLTSDNTRTIDSPTLATVNQGIGALIQAATNAGHTAGSNVLFTQESMHSVDQGMLKMGLSAKFTGVEISTNLEVSHSAERTNVTAYFIQRMFTVAVVPPSTPQAFFSDSFSPEKLQDQVDLDRLGADNLPVYVSNISYGRMLMFSLSSTSTAAEIKAALNVVLESGGEGGGGHLSAGQASLMENAQIKVVTVGGDAANALALIRSGNLADFFRTDAPLTSARPISYTVRNLADNTIAKVSETTEYSLSECTAAAVVPTGAVYEITMQKLTYVAFGGGGCINPWPWIEGYDFDVYDNLGQHNASTWGPVRAADSNSMHQGDILSLAPPTDLVAATFQLHNDGRLEEPVRLVGDVYDTASNHLSWNLTFTNELTVGTTEFTVGNGESDACSSPDCACHRFRITFNVKWVRDLTD